jgi:dipeptidyl aminopeptidase/acylaminoacyl peptidase
MMIPRRIIQSIVAAIVASTSIASARAQSTVRPMDIRDALSAPTFHVQARIASISPDGARIAYTVCDPVRAAADTTPPSERVATFGAAYRSLGCDIWMTDTRAAHPGERPSARNITDAAGNNWGAAWSPDGTKLAFYSDRNGGSRLWVWDLKTGTQRQMAAVRTMDFFSFEKPVWTPDGRAVIVKLWPEGKTEDELRDEQGASTGSPRTPTTAQKRDTASAHTTLRLYRSGDSVPAARIAGSDTGFVPVKGFGRNYADLGRIDVTTGSVTRLARGVRSLGYLASPDGKWIAYFDDIGRPKSAATGIANLMIVDADGGAPRKIARVQQAFTAGASWSPDSRSIAYLSGAPKQGSLFVVTVGGRTPREFADSATHFDADFLPPLWNASGTAVFAANDSAIWRGDLATGHLTRVTRPITQRGVELLALGDDTPGGNQVWTINGGASLVFTAHDPAGSTSGFYSVNLTTGAVTALREDVQRYGRVFSTPRVARNGTRVVYEAESASQPQDLWITDARFTDAQRLTTIAPALERYTLGRTRGIDFRSADGVPLHATLLLPAGYREGTRVPMVVWVYASDTTSERALTTYGLVGFGAYNMHMLSTRGYAVLWPDIPVHTGSPMQDLMKAVMPAIDRVIELGIADSSKLAVMGQSNGGYSTLALITQTHRFKAASMNAGFGDLTGFYGAMSPADGSGVWHPWLQTLGGGMGVAPWQAPFRYVQNSPVYYLDRITTPLLMEAGGDDAAIVPFSDQVFVGLKSLNKNVTYLRYGGEGHVLAQYGNLMDFWTRLLAFFGENLGVRSN